MATIKEILFGAMCAMPFVIGYQYTKPYLPEWFVSSIPGGNQKSNTVNGTQLASRDVATEIEQRRSELERLIAANKDTPRSTYNVLGVGAPAAQSQSEGSISKSTKSAVHETLTAISVEFPSLTGIVPNPQPTITNENVWRVCMAPMGIYGAPCMNKYSLFRVKADVFSDVIYATLVDIPHNIEIRYWFGGQRVSKIYDKAEILVYAQIVRVESGKIFVNYPQIVKLLKSDP